MIDSTAAYKAAITGDIRRTYLLAVVDIISPSVTFGTATVPAAAKYSNTAQLHDLEFRSEDNIVTLEKNRWLLDGTFEPLPAKGTNAEIGYVSAAAGDSAGAFDSPMIITQPISGVDVLQACTIQFSDRTGDGVALDFVLEILKGSTVAQSFSVTGNREPRYIIDGFTVDSPTSLRLTVTRWSMPDRRVRIIELMPGLHEEWDNDRIVSCSIIQQTNFSNLSLPYGTCQLVIDNSDRRFEPRNKGGLFRSIEERQSIKMMIGVELEDGSVDYKPVGRYYQYSGGWTTGNNGLTIQWDLVDIIGLLTDRHIPNNFTAPTTLKGWAEFVCKMLGDNFKDQYIVDSAHANDSLRTSASTIADHSCGELIRNMCMATGTWCRADAVTGKLKIEALPVAGGEVLLDNMVSYPTLKANEDIGSITFVLSSTSQLVIDGNEPASNNSVTISNPFITTQAAARTAGAQILRSYGGNVFEITGRGDPASELGDVDMIELGGGMTGNGRRQSQSFSYTSGVLRDCQATFLEVSNA